MNPFPIKQFLVSIVVPFELLLCLKNEGVEDFEIIDMEEDQNAYFH